MAKRKLEAQYEEQSQMNDVKDENIHMLKNELEQLRSNIETLIDN